MKKSILLFILMALLLVGCTTAEENVSKAEENVSKEVLENMEQVELENEMPTQSEIPAQSDTVSQNDTTSQNDITEVLTLFKADAESEYVEPYEVEYDGDEDGLVRFIYDRVVIFEVGLIDYKFDNNGKSLVLNLDDNIYNVQGSAGGHIFAGTIVESYFANYPNLEQVTFIHNGSYETSLDHLLVGEPYTRAEALENKEQVELENEVPTQNDTTEVLTLFKADAESEYVEPYEVEYDGEEDGLVRFIYDRVVIFEVGLIDYKFDNNGKSLVLNLDDNIYNVQGSAGGHIFAGTIVESYFANYPNLEQVTFIHNGSYETSLDHLLVGEPYTRADETFTNQ